MKNKIILLLLILFASCETSESDKYRKLISTNTSKTIYQTVNLETSEIELDTIGSNWNGKRFITKEILEIKEDEKIHIANISTYDFEKDIVKETFLNYDIIRDSINHLDTSSYKIGKIKRYNIEGKHFEIIKEPRSIFNKSKIPNRYTFISKDFGLIATITRTKKVRLLAFEQRRLTKEENKLIELLTNDEEFFSLKKEN